MCSIHCFQGGFIGRTYEECLAHLAARVARERAGPSADERAAAEAEIERRRASMKKAVAEQRARMVKQRSSRGGGGGGVAGLLSGEK